MATGWYVMIKDGNRRALLYGPVTTQDQAAAKVEAACKIAEEYDRYASFYDCGTAKVTVAPSKGLPVGKFNERIDGS